VAAALKLGRKAALFEDNGYATLTPGWPDDPETVEEATEHPEAFAGKSIGEVADTALDFVKRFTGNRR
jgi:hypothetical protein